VRLDHIGIAVTDLPAAELLYLTAMGGRIVGREELPAEQVRLVFIEAGGALFELLAPAGAEGPIARFLTSRGEGLHHLAFEVSDLEDALRDAAAAGMRPVDAQPRRGARGRLIAFLHPSAARGVLVELVQRPSPRSSAGTL
jgi:methylmalonyl-CoA epimerase